MPRSAHSIRAWHLPPERAPNRGHAAATEAALDHELILHLGALPLVLPLLDQLGLREIVNRRCHPTETTLADLDLGLVTGVLVLNRLLAPKPLVHVETWLAGTVVPDLWGIEALQCNDDRLARALDALYPHLAALWQDLIVAAVRTFALDLTRLAHDITSVSFCGAYAEAELLRFGYSRDHRPDRKQLELATTVTLNGGLPLDYRVLAGNVADRTTPVETLQRLQRLLALLPPRPAGAPAPLVVSDRAMLTLEAIAAYEASALHYLGPLDPHLGEGAVQALLAAVPAAELAAPETALAYRPQRAATTADWVPYHGVPQALVLPHPEPGRPGLRVQALVVWSPGKARVDAQVRAAQLDRLEAALADLASKLGRRPYTTVAAVEKRVATLLRRHPARPYRTRDGGEWRGRPDAELEPSRARAGCCRRPGRPVRAGHHRPDPERRRAVGGEQAARCSREAVRDGERATGGAPSVPPQGRTHRESGVLHAGGAVGICPAGMGRAAGGRPPIGRGPAGAV
jgi:hypothetical protein